MIDFAYNKKSISNNLIQNLDIFFMKLITNLIHTSTTFFISMRVYNNILNFSIFSETLISRLRFYNFWNLGVTL